MRKNSGSALVDYVVPTLVVGVVAGVAVYTLYASGNLTNFLASSGDMNLDKSTKTAIIDPISSPYGNSTSGNSVYSNSNSNANVMSVDCKTNNTCDIDFGPFVLSGIPSDNSYFNDINGKPGTTADQTGVFAALLDQMADAVEVNDPQTAKLIKLFSSSVGIMSEKEKLMQTYDNQAIGKTFLWIFGTGTTQDMLENELGSFGYKGKSFNILNLISGNKNVNNGLYLTFDQSLSSIDNNNQLTFTDSPLPSDLDKNALLSMSETDLADYLKNKPSALASVYYGLWDEIQNSGLSPDIKHAIDTTAKEVAMSAGAIDLSDKSVSSGFLSITKTTYFDANFNNSTDFASYLNKIQSF